MLLVNQADTVLEPLFKDLPQIPEQGRESLAKIWPWITLVVGILQLGAAYSLWQLTRVVDVLNNLSLYATGGTAGISTADKLFIYLGVALLVVQGVIFLLAFSPLRQRVRRGWDLIFLAALISLASDVVSIFINGRGVGNFIFSLIGSAIGFYLIYQVKAKFSATSATTPPPVPPAV